MGINASAFQFAQDIPLTKYNYTSGAGGEFDISLLDATETDASIFLTVYPTVKLNEVETTDLTSLGKQILAYHSSPWYSSHLKFGPGRNTYGFAPTSYVEGWKMMYAAIKAIASDTEIVWSPNSGYSYPYGYTTTGLSTADADALDTNGDGDFDSSDDAYSPYYPGSDYVDWAGLSYYEKDATYPCEWNHVRCPDEEQHGDGYSILPDLLRIASVLHFRRGAAYHYNNDTQPSDAVDQLDLQQLFWQNTWANASIWTTFPKLKVFFMFECEKEEEDDLRDYRITYDSTLRAAYLDDISSRVPGVCVEATYRSNASIADSSVASSIVSSLAAATATYSSPSSSTSTNIMTNTERHAYRTQTPTLFGGASAWRRLDWNSFFDASFMVGKQEMHWASLPHALIVLLPLMIPGATSSAAPSSSPPRPRERYGEALRLTPLRDGKLHSHFNFTFTATNWREGGDRLGPNSNTHHHTLLPPELTALVRHYRVTSFDLTLSSGRWDSSWPTRSTAVSGIQLIAWLELLDGESPKDERQRWDDFKNALGGLFCTGVTSGISAGESRPLWGNTLRGGADEREHRLYRTTIPRLSATCTESLTPFLSLLPCASYAGLSSLLNPHRLFDSDWTLLGVHVLRDSQAHSIQLQVGAVADPIRQDRLKGFLGRRGMAQSLQSIVHPDLNFSFESLYDRTLQKACPVATESLVQVAIPTDSINPFRIEPSSHGRTIVHIDGKDVVQWDTRQVNETLNVVVDWPDVNMFEYLPGSNCALKPLIVRRLLHGTGQERGRIGIELINNLDSSADVIWIETWPWWLRAFISTLSTTSNATHDSAGSSDHVVRSLDYSPPIARARATTLQALLRLPPRSTTRLMMAYESSYLWYTEYPSDAHRGFEILGASLVLLNPSNSSSNETSQGSNALRTRSEWMRLHTSSTLLSLPTPDFSMPYNVIILTSTIVALFFGSLMNRLVRGWRVVSLDEQDAEHPKQGRREKAL
ncbi:BQ2448_7450 [Microbotryum intermedium]|uniref:BQ2448_7450 protein n=1 Tax=Microbotryum intermedium TaxID=269621 RepID=A0A238FNS1_9BASI|nr:BQ2448_7450 [Microbotryum intermedium]